MLSCYAVPTCCQNKGEKNYHIFYLLTHGAPEGLRASLQLKGEFTYLAKEVQLSSSSVLKFDEGGYARPASQVWAASITLQPLSLNKLVLSASR